MTVIIQHEAFDISAEVDKLRQGSQSVGAIVTFLGLVRDINDDKAVTRLRLEHYPGMAEKSIAAIIEAARRRWAIDAVRVVHRVGDLGPAELIVFVGVAGQHRADAFAACEFIMDHLKTAAPFWKKEQGPDGDHWLESRESDRQQLARWRAE